MTKNQQISTETPGRHKIQKARRPEDTQFETTVVEASVEAYVETSNMYGRIWFSVAPVY